MKIERLLEIIIKVKEELKEFGILLFSGVGFISGMLACMILIAQMGGDQPKIFNILFYVFTRWLSLLFVLQILSLIFALIIWRKNK